MMGVTGVVYGPLAVRPTWYRSRKFWVGFMVGTVFGWAMFWAVVVAFSKFM